MGRRPELSTPPLPFEQPLGDFSELVDLRLEDVLRRWPRPPWERPPWVFRRPCTLRILMYADFAGAYAGGPFLGLTHVIATLTADPYPWVQFRIGRANRVADPSADQHLAGKTLDAINLDDWDELWLFGLGGGQGALSKVEIDAVRAWMDRGGGVLVTGDHDDLGAGIGRQIPRAGQMRRWGQPSASGPDRHSTLRSGANTSFDFDDQSDDVPQEIRLREYPLISWWHPVRRRPHPLFCGPDGPIRVLPDHMHEGEAVVPAQMPANDWPSVGPVQPTPEVVAWGRIVQPGLDGTGTEFGVVGAYDGHGAGVGRISADSTWHHWFDINVVGLGTAGRQGFTTSAGAGFLRAIEAYFLNTAIWLAPPAKQMCMRNRAVSGALWSDRLVMLDPKLPVWAIGEAALDALGRTAPRCTIRDWIWPFLPIEIRELTPLDPVEFARFVPLIEESAAGAAFRPLVEQTRDNLTPPRTEREVREMDERVDAAFASAWDEGLGSAIELARGQMKRTQALRKTLQKAR